MHAHVHSVHVHGVYVCLCLELLHGKTAAQMAAPVSIRAAVSGNKSINYASFFLCHNYNLSLMQSLSQWCSSTIKL